MYVANELYGSCFEKRLVADLMPLLDCWIEILDYIARFRCL